MHFSEAGIIFSNVGNLGDFVNNISYAMDKDNTAVTRLISFGRFQLEFYPRSRLL
jgi:hypothetical protein